MFLIKAVLFTFCPSKKETKGKGQRQKFDFMNVSLASKNLKIT